MRYLSISFLVALMSILTCNAQTTNDWQPTMSNPFVYEKFIPAVVLTNSGQTLRVQGNIHLAHSYLWYQSTKEKLQAGAGIVKKVTFNDGAEYVPVGDKLCKVLRTDTIGEKVFRLLSSRQIDKREMEQRHFNEKNANLVLNSLSSEFNVVGESAAEAAEMLPLRNVFYMEIGDDSFEMNNSNILRHLSSKQERTTFNAYIRKAEILFDSERSMSDIYETFFLNKER